MSLSKEIDDVLIATSTNSKNKKLGYVTDVLKFPEVKNWDESMFSKYNNIVETFDAKSSLDIDWSMPNNLAKSENWSMIKHIRSFWVWNIVRKSLWVTSD